MIKQIILAFWGSVFPVILFNIDRKKIVWTGICGALGWTTYLIVYKYTYSPVVSSLSGSIIVGIYSEIMARKLKTPSTEFSIPGIFPLVPGITAYNCIQQLVEHNYSGGYSKALQTLAVGGAIAFGLMLSTTAFRYISFASRQLKQKNKLEM